MPFCLRFNSPKKKNNLECVEDILTQSAYIDFGGKYGLNLTSEFILSFIWRVPLKVTVQHSWKTIETDRSDSVKGYNGCLIEPVNALVLKPLRVVGMRGKGFILGMEEVKIVDEMAATRSYLIHVSNFVHQHFLLIKKKLKGNRMSETQKLKKKKKSWQQKNSHVGLISMVAFIFQFVVM